MYYKVWLKLQKINKEMEISYYEKWVMEKETFEVYTKPIINEVFKRKVPDFLKKDSYVNPSDFYEVIIEATPKKDNPAHREILFQYGRDLIREFIKDDSLHIKD